MKNKLTVAFVIFSHTILIAQNGGQLHGNFQTDFQFYQEDSLIGAQVPAEKSAMMSYANFIYTVNNFSAGMRYEAYLNTPAGFDKRYNGMGIPYRYASYRKDNLSLTVGNFYEQFGSGLILRTYEDKQLGVDNALDGILVKMRLFDGIYLKALAGKQRFFWDKGDGIVRGIDGEVNMNEVYEKWINNKINIILGGSFVSKFQTDKDPVYNLPENVGAGAGRINIMYGGFNLQSEYAYKVNDPSAENGMIYGDGQALMFTGTYTRKGLGLMLQAKSLYNMGFRSDRTANLTNLSIGYVPAISKTHSYTMTAMYPYASQPNGETGLMADVFYFFEKKSFLGGKYGTKLAINYSRVQAIDKKQINDTIAIGQSGTLGFKTELFSFSDERYFEDVNFEVNKKFSKRLRGIFIYQNQFYNYNLLRGKNGHKNVYANIGLVDLTYRFSNKHALETQIQALFTEQDMGNWAMLMLEYTMAPHWFFGVIDQYNYGNEEKDMQIHYYNISFGYNYKSSRIQIGYGKQRAGIFCVGGVCREVPALYGLTVSLSSTF